MVISEERALAMLAEANPIPDEASLVLDTPHLDDIDQRSSTVAQLASKPKTTDTGRQSSRRWLVAAISIAVIGLAVFWVNMSDDGSPAAEDPTAIAQEFIDARNAYDGERMAALFDPDAALTFEVVETVEDYPTLADFERAIGWQHRPGTCTSTEISGQGSDRWMLVECPYQSENEWSRALGLEPFGDSNFQFTIADGQIKSLTNQLDFEEFGAVFDEFVTWLEENHPDDLARMIDLDVPGPLHVPRLTNEALELWEQHTDEFVASMSGR